MSCPPHQAARSLCGPTLGFGQGTPLVPKLTQQYSRRPTNKEAVEILGEKRTHPCFGEHSRRQGRPGPPPVESNIVQERWGCRGTKESILPAAFSLTWWPLGAGEKTIVIFFYLFFSGSEVTSRATDMQILCPTTECHHGPKSQMCRSVRACPNLDLPPTSEAHVTHIHTHMTTLL